MQNEKLVTLPGSTFSGNLHYSFQEQVAETKKEINIP